MDILKKLTLENQRKIDDLAIELYIAQNHLSKKLGVDLADIPIKAYSLDSKELRIAFDSDLYTDSVMEKILRKLIREARLDMTGYYANIYVTVKGEHEFSFECRGFSLDGAGNFIFQIQYHDNGWIKGEIMEEGKAKYYNEEEMPSLSSKEESKASFAFIW